MSLVFFHLCKELFSGFLQFKGKFVDGQNTSKYRDRAPLRLLRGLNRFEGTVTQWVPACSGSLCCSSCFLFGKRLGYHSACLLDTSALIELAIEKKSWKV